MLRATTAVVLLFALGVLTGCDAQASRIASDWGMRSWAVGASDDAVACFNAAIELNPTNCLHYSHRGMIWSQRRSYQKALLDYKEAVRLDDQGEHPFQTYNALAWFLATCPDDTFRDGKQAVRLARKACELSDWENAGILDTLAAAYAEEGDFGQAVVWQLKAVAMADETLKPELMSRLPLYRAHQPYRE